MSRRGEPTRFAEAGFDVEWRGWPPYPDRVPRPSTWLQDCASTAGWPKSWVRTADRRREPRVELGADDLARSCEDSVIEAVRSAGYLEVEIAQEPLRSRSLHGSGSSLPIRPIWKWRGRLAKSEAGAAFAHLRGGPSCTMCEHAFRCL
jgi:hypothetical protein